MTRFLYKHWTYYLYIGLSIAGCIMISACRQAPVSEPPQPSTSFIDESRIEANKQAMQFEDQKIRQYISRMGWHMKETGTGLRYMITESGHGPKATVGRVAHFDYELRLITGELCYSSQKTGPKEFRIGSGGVESGLEEGILLLHKGDRVKFILPSHLAFGLVGDQNKIPGRYSLIYDVHLIDLH
jgi:FKBP-type peptidyl-prolyl cis-trans isomerase FkpA